MPTDDQARLLAELALELQQAPGEVSTAEAVAKRALEFLPAADWVSLTLRRRRSYVTLASTSDESRTLDRWQYELNEGPCVDAAQGVEWFRSGDVGNDRRW